MKNRQNIIISLLSIVIIAFLFYTNFNNESLFDKLVVFSFVGIGLAFLRMIINSFIKKTKGKPVYYKIIFFAVLLSFGVPFQNWFRKEVVMSMDSVLILPAIIYTATVVVLTTLVTNIFIKNKK